jgi:RHS repeat-associated protein
VRTYDEDGNLDQLDSAGLRTYAQDDAFRITGITDTVSSALSWTLGYDSLDRLTSASRTGQSQSFTYDANGNRLTQGGSSSSTYTVSSTSNRLSSISGALTRTYGYDAAGNTTSYGAFTFGYSDAGRLTSVSGSATASYQHNALGQRVKKTVSGSSTYFVYDEAGHLIGEYDGSGNLIQETVWLGDIPVATLRPNGGSISIFYIHTDHLSTPRRISRPSDNVIVWRWDSDPFGTDAANQDPDGDSTAFAYQLRFPGQYFDAETGLSYNYFRNYDPAIGRYVESDPIGLAAGPNTYAYVESRPLATIDPFGLQAFDPGPSPVDPNPGRRGPDTKKRRDKRTPWLPPHLAKRGDCAPYQRITDGYRDSIFSGLIPLVAEQVIQETECQKVVLCVYEGTITLGANWAETKFRVRRYKAAYFINVPKEGGNCCENQ